MAPSGPIVIDWFDAAIGHPVADVVRSSILMRPPIAGAEHPHLPGGSPDALKRIHRSYAARFEALLRTVVDELASWGQSWPRRA
jgi:hypothetical protein